MNTLPEEVEIVLNEYFKVFNTNLPNLMESFYVIGSLVLNDYHPGRSDVDFVSVIKRGMASEELNILKGIHKKISSKYHKTVLEGSYVTPQQIDKLDNDIGPVVYFDRKKVRYDDKSGNVGIITWLMLKNYAITLIGKQPEHYIPNIDVSDLVSYVQLNANTYWVEWTEKAGNNLSITGISALFEQKVEWGVLGISRLYYTMHEKDIVSKYEAGVYTRDKVPKSFKRIIKEALRIRKGEDKKSYYRSPFRRRKDMLLFMRYMINQFPG